FADEDERADVGVRGSGVVTDEVRVQPEAVRAAAHDARCIARRAHEGGPRRAELARELRDELAMPLVEERAADADRARDEVHHHARPFESLGVARGAGAPSKRGASFFLLASYAARKSGCAMQIAWACASASIAAASGIDDSLSSICFVIACANA